MLGAQGSGFYNYYLWHLMGIKNNIEVSGNLADYNVNKDKYTDLYGNERYKIIKQSDLEGITIAPELQAENLNGIFKDKNLVLVQLESINQFILGLEEGSILNEPWVLPHLKKIRNQSYNLNNFYEGTGIGHSSDGHITTLMGINPIGNRTLYWDYIKRPFKVPFSIPVLFKNSGYETAIIEADYKEFYNADIINKEVYEFDHHYYYDESKGYDDKYNGFKEVPKLTDFEGKPLKLRYSNKTQGMDDKSLPSWLNHIKDDLKEPYFMHPVTLHPHTPFVGAPKNHNLVSRVKLSTIGNGHLDYLKYIDRYFEEFIKLANEMTNTVFIFYGDHGQLGI